jgi:hypothetical protein
MTEEHQQQVDTVLYALQGVWGDERSEPVTPPHSPIGGAHAKCIFEDMCAAKTERMNPHQQPDKLLASGQEVRSTRRVGAPSGRCPE